MPLHFPCSCGRQLQVADDLAGKRVRCPSCQHIVWAPAPGAAIPEARIVDGPKAAGEAVPVAAVDVPSPAGQKPPRVCAARHDLRAATGFAVSTGSLLFGVIAHPFPAAWIVLGLTGALISLGALRRIRAGRAPATSVGIARAGVVLGMGQAVLAAFLCVALSAGHFRSGCPMSGQFRHGCGMRKPQPCVTAPAQQKAPAVQDEEQVQPSETK